MKKPIAINGSALSDNGPGISATNREEQRGEQNRNTTRSRRGRRKPPRPTQTQPYDALLWRLAARADGGLQKCQSLGLVGCDPKSGVTTLAANLAVRACELQLGPVLLVEANGRGSSAARKWRLASGPGLVDLLAGQAAYGDCVREGPIDGLDVLPLGGGRGGESSAFEAGMVESLLADAGVDHALVLFDLPSAGRLHHTLLLAKQLDQVLLVIRAESTHQRDVQRVCDRLTEDGVPVAGAILNRQRAYLPRWLNRWL